MGKKVISEIKARRVYAGPGSYAFVAEAMVYDDETDQLVYVTIQKYDGTEYTVADKSVYAFLAEDKGSQVSKFLEEYTTAEGAKGSEYGKVFDILKKNLAAIG